MAFKEPDSKPEFNELESRISKYWRENKTFQKSVAQRKGKEQWRFFDGPPFISGTPHYGHIKDFIVKDAVPRYWAMKGYYTPRVWGWDCHGLPIENKVEKKLGIKSKLEVEQMGTDKYIEECYDYTRSTSAEWPWYVEKIGRWIDYDHAYRTMDQDYMESVWWVFKNLWEKGLIYKGWRSSLYSTDSATPVSNFEIAMDNTYEDVEDDTVTVKFKLKQDDKFKKVFADQLDKLNSKDVSFLIWTTTPWTIPSNFAIAVHPDEDYALIETSTDNAKITGKWLLSELPFDFDKFSREKIEVYYLSFTGEKVESSAQLEQSSRSDYDELTELELAVEKRGKKFFFREGDNLTEIQQQEFQKFIKESKNSGLADTRGPLRKSRVYYRASASEAADELSESAVKRQTVLHLDLYESDLEGLRIVEVDFNSPVEYMSFKQNLPEWFGKEVTTSTDLSAENLIQDSYSNLITKLNSAEDYPAQLDSNSDTYVQYVILASKLAETNIKGEYKIIATFTGKDFEALEYQQIYDFFPGEGNDHKVYTSEIVTSSDGTGVLHIAPAFGEEDFEVGLKHKLSFSPCIDDAGKMLPETGKFAGIYLRDAAWPIINDLKEKGLLYKTEKFTHRLPFYRYENPLIYKAQESWFIDVQKLKPQLLEQNENINWVPDHLKEGRFKIGIENAPDWSISRTRYWSTTMPVWVREDSENPGSPMPNYSDEDTIIVGSRDELRQLAEQKISKVEFVTYPANASFAKLSEDLDLQKFLDEDLDNKLKDRLDAENKLKEVANILTDKNKNSQELAQLLLNKISAFPGGKVAGVSEDADLGEESFTQELATTISNLKKTHNVSRISDLEEAGLKTEFANIIPTLKERFHKFLLQNEGANLIAVTNSETLALVKHIFEGKTLKESFAGLAESLSGEEYEIGSYTMYFVGSNLLDLHKSGVDKVTVLNKETDARYIRVAEVLDVWLDSGSMPFAQLHYPFENQSNLESSFPGDYVVEYIAQTRAWFYVMHVLGVALTGSNPFKNVVTSGVIFGTDGRKMSKTYGNYPDPKQTLENYGAEAMRWYFLTSKLISGEDVNFDEKALRDNLRMYLLPIWNIYKFLVTYANVHNWKPNSEIVSNEANPHQTVFAVPDGGDIETYWYKVPFKSRSNKLDEWMIALLQKTIHNVRAEMDNYYIPKATRMLEEFVDILSKWYIRRSRERFNDGDTEALETLYYIVVEFAKLTAPFTPFLSEEIYANLVHAQLSEVPESVHLSDYPQADMDYLEKHAKLLKQMEVIQEITAVGQSVRTQNGLKVRQPLATLRVKVNTDSQEDYELEEWMKEIIAAELNVNEVVEKHTLHEEEGWVMQQGKDDNLVISLDTRLNAELELIGLQREFVRQVQSTRKWSGLNIGDEINLTVMTTSENIMRLKDSMIEIAKDVNAKDIDFVYNKELPALSVDGQEGDDYKEVKINGERILLKIVKV